MNENEKGYNYSIGIYDVLCKAIRKKVRAEAYGEKPYGIGVYTDEYCQDELMTLPMKPLSARMEIARCLEGVNFVFPVDTKDKERIEEIAQEAYRRYLEENEKREKAKRYKVGIAIGSFDVFHAGHLENLMLAKEMCEKLVVVVKTDERILKKKGKSPRQSTAERAAILKLMNFIDHVSYMDIDTTRQDIISEVAELYKGINLKDIVAVFGTDLQKKEETYIDTDWKDINVAFTTRDSEKMKVVSSSNYQRICDENGGIVVLEKKEEETLR